MEIVKLGRIKVKKGDCVSIKSSYFGKAFEQEMKDMGFSSGLLYGRVVEVIDGNRDFNIKWDIDNQISKNMSLDKVNIEKNDTPKQVSLTSKINEKDYQTADQCSSKTACQTHALLIEEFDIPVSDDSYMLMKNTKECFIAKMYSTKPGDMVHNKELLHFQRKFKIEKIMNEEWDGFDEDVHCVGSFIAWDNENAILLVKETCNTNTKKPVKRKEKFRLRIKQPIQEEQEEQDIGIANHENKSKNKRKIIKKNSTSKTTNSKGKQFRKNLSEYLGKKTDTDSEYSDEEIAPPKSKNKKNTVNNKSKKNVIKKNVNKKDATYKSSDYESSDTTEIESETDEEVDDHENEVQSNKKNDKKDDWKKEWKKGGWTMDPNERLPYGPKLHLECSDMVDELSYLMRFLPMNYINNIIVPATNNIMSIKGIYKEITTEEFMKFIGLIYIMEVVKLPKRRLYWGDLGSMTESIIPKINFGKHMTKHRFEEILRCLQFSHHENQDTQIIEFLEAVNENLADSLSPGNIVTLDESMIKSYHRNLRGKIKIKRKPRPIGNEIKDMADSRTNIAVRLELYEGREVMQQKDHVAEYGATCATTLRLTSKIHGTGRIVIADSWFGSVKTAIALMQNGLYSIMLVKTAHRLFPRDALNSHDLEQGEWAAYTANMEGVNLQAVTFQDLKKKQFISTCSTILPGKARKTKHHGDIDRPKVAEVYLNNAAAIDIHNHVRTGTTGLEDAILTKSPQFRQFTGILGFLFTNSFLAFKYFKPNQSKLEHTNFKIALACRLINFSMHSTTPLGRHKKLLGNTTDEARQVVHSHTPIKLSYPVPCYYCRHGYDKSERLTTTFKCSFCKIPIHKSTYKKRNCWELHITNGIPSKRRALLKRKSQ